MQVQIQIENEALLRKIREQAGELATRDLALEALHDRLQKLQQANQDLSEALTRDREPPEVPASPG